MSLTTALTGATALRARIYTCGTSDTLCALSGDRRIPRRDRMADDHRRDPGRHGSAADADQSRYLRQRADRRQARGRPRFSDNAASPAAPLKKPVHPPRRPVGGIRRDASCPGDGRLVARRGAGWRLDVPAATRGRAYVAVEARRAPQFFLDRIAVTRRRCARRHVRHHHHLVAQHDRHRDRDPKRSEYRARPQGARACQSIDRGARRICQLYVAEPLHPGPPGRRNQPNSRTDGRRDFGGRADRRSRIPWLCAEIRPRGGFCFFSAPASSING